MTISSNRKIAITCGLALAGIAFLLLVWRSDRAQPKTHFGLEASPAPHLPPAQTCPSALSSAAPPVAPFIVTDTATDSPGTNLVTRIVTFTAAIGGTPPIFLQWKVDKGSGFEAVSRSATNSVFTISNAVIANTGLYALFATNCVGGTKTTPVPLVVVEGVD